VKLKCNEIRTSTEEEDDFKLNVVCASQSYLVVDDWKKRQTFYHFNTTQ
jgi:hypothetical protein